MRQQGGAGTCVPLRGLALLVVSGPVELWISAGNANMPTSCSKAAITGSLDCGAWPVQPEAGGRPHEQWSAVGGNQCS